MILAEPLRILRRRPRQRELAIKYTLKTFELAERVKAPAVVLHLGSMDLKDYTEKLTEMLERDGKKSPKYEKLRAEAAAKREASKGKAVERTYETFRQLLPEAEKRGLKLGIENGRRSRNFPWKATSSFSFVSLTARMWFIGTTLATRKSRKTSAFFTTPSISITYRAPPDFTFTTFSFPRTTMPHPAPAR